MEFRGADNCVPMGVSDVFGAQNSTKVVCVMDLRLTRMIGLTLGVLKLLRANFWVVWIKQCGFVARTMDVC